MFPNGNGNGSTTFGVADYRDRAAVARGNMGGTAASRLTSGVSGMNSSRLGAAGGDQNTPSQQLAGRYGTPNASGVTWLNAVTGDQITFASPMPGDGNAIGTGSAGNVQPSIIENVAIYAGV